MLELKPRGAFEGLLHSSGTGGGVWVQPVNGCGMASILARKGQAQAVATALKTAFGLDLPASPAVVSTGTTAFVGQAPGMWLGLQEGNEDWHRVLSSALADLASVVDQSGGYGLLRVGGPKVLALLAKGLFLDLDPTAFPVGSAAASNLAHVSVSIWKRQPDQFELQVPRSFAPAFAHWLEESAAEYGLELRGF